MTKHLGFDAKIDRSAGPDACWLWLASKAPGGYGQVRINRVLVRAHRVAYERAVGPVPDGLHVLHRCDNPPCCNPAHLFVGTRSDNMRDMVAKGRHYSRTKPECLSRGERHGSRTKPESVQRGERNASARVTEDAVRAMRAMREAGAQFRDIGAAFGVGARCAWAAVTGRSWSHVTR